MFKKIKKRKEQKKEKEKRNLRDIYSRSGPGLDILYFCFCCVLEAFLFFLSVVFCLLCFRLVFLSFCLNTTQYTTLNTNKHEMGLFMTCVKCSKTLKYQSSNTTYNTNVFSCVFACLYITAIVSPARHDVL